MDFRHLASLIDKFLWLLVVTVALMPRVAELFKRYW